MALKFKKKSINFSESKNSLLAKLLDYPENNSPKKNYQTPKKEYNYYEQRSIKRDEDTVSKNKIDILYKELENSKNIIKELKQELDDSKQDNYALESILKDNFKLLYDHFLAIEKKDFDKTKAYYTIKDYLNNNLDILTQFNICDSKIESMIDFNQTNSFNNINSDSNNELISTPPKNNKLFTFKESFYDNKISRSSSSKKNYNININLNLNDNEETEKKQVLYIALYAFTPSKPGDLKIIKGTILELISKNDDGWYVCRDVQTNLSGFVPGNFLRLLSNKTT